MSNLFDFFFVILYFVFFVCVNGVVCDIVFDISFVEDLNNFFFFIIFIEIGMVCVVIIVFFNSF